ncbi:hypothetical protein [Nitrosococcus oceani]|uniref:hypothetical protein n=1 Tax=Nitrosococcus oceani TaxID=1229 RepID=UPI0004E903FE|nr:hypothetical protein [Nitrosococcus oceani]KFI23212.1 hypothetical protein HW44_05175 [Nitrosococcus oceani]
MSHMATKQTRALPCVVQIGFAGSRQLFEKPPADPDAERQWRNTVEQYLVKSLGELPRQLKLSSHHFLCGISQIACGADTLFSRACQTLQIPQRLFLPQPAGDYLAAASSSGTPDFTPAQRREAESLLASEHIIQQRVISQSPDRTERFRETNAEILRVSDAIVCLLRDDSQDKAGGTNELLERAKAIGVPALEIRIAVQNSHPVCHHTWHSNSDRPFRPPAVPEPLDQFSLLAGEEKFPATPNGSSDWKEFASGWAKKHQQLFRYAAALIITLHILATLCATVALASPNKRRYYSSCYAELMVTMGLDIMNGDLGENTPWLPPCRLGPRALLAR